MVPLLRQGEQGDFSSSWLLFSLVLLDPHLCHCLLQKGLGKGKEKWRKEKFTSGNLVNTFTQSLIRKSLGIIHGFHFFILHMAPFNTTDEELNVLERDSVS